jgi:hypothetical protein
MYVNLSWRPEVDENSVGPVERVISKKKHGRVGQNCRLYKYLNTILISVFCLVYIVIFYYQLDNF